MKNTVCVVILVLVSLAETYDRFERKPKRGLSHLEKLNDGGYEVSESESNHQGNIISLNTASSSNSEKANNNYGTATSYTVDHGNIQEITITRKIPVPVPTGNINNVYGGGLVIPLENNKLNTVASQKGVLSKPISISVSHPVVVEKSIPLPYQSYSSNSNDCKGGTCGDWIAIRSSNKNTVNPHFTNSPNVNLQSSGHILPNIGFNEPIRGQQSGSKTAFPAITPSILNSNHLIFHSAPTKNGDRNKAAVSSFNFHKNKSIRPINYNNHLGPDTKNKGEQFINNAVNQNYGPANNIHGSASPEFINNVGANVPIIIDNYDIPIPINALNIQGNHNRQIGGHYSNNNFRGSIQNGAPQDVLYNTRDFGVFNGHSGDIKGLLPILVDNNNNNAFQGLTFNPGDLNTNFRNEYGGNIVVQNGHHNSGLHGSPAHYGGASINGHINQIPVHNGNINSIAAGNILQNVGNLIPNNGVSFGHLNNIGQFSAVQNGNHGPSVNSVPNRGNRYANIGIIKGNGNYVDLPVLNNIIPRPFSVNGNTPSKNQGILYGSNTDNSGKNPGNYNNNYVLNQFAQHPFLNNENAQYKAQNNFQSNNAGNQQSNYVDIPVLNKFGPQLTGTNGNTPNKAQIISFSGSPGNHGNIGNYFKIPILNQLLPQPFSSNGNTNNKAQINIHSGSAENQKNNIGNYDDIPILNKFGSHRFNSNGNVHTSVQANFHDSNNIGNNINNFGISNNVIPNNIPVSNGLNIKAHGNGINGVGLSFVNENPVHTGHGNIKNVLHSISGVKNTGNNIFTGNTISSSHNLSPNDGKINGIPILNNIGSNNGQLEDLLKNLILHATAGGNNIGKIPLLPSVYDTQNPGLVSNFKNSLHNGGVNSGNLIGGHIKNIPVNNFGPSLTPNFGTAGNNIGHVQNTFGNIPANHAKSTVTFLNIGNSGKITSDSLTNNGKQNAIALVIENGGNFDTISSNSGTHSAHLNGNNDNSPFSLEFGEIVYGKKKQNVEIISGDKGQNEQFNNDFQNSGLGILENLVITTAGNAGNNHNSISYSSSDKGKQSSDSFGKYNSNEPPTKNLAISGVELIGNSENNIVSSTETILVTPERVEETSSKPDEKTEVKREEYGNKLKTSSKIVSRETLNKSDKKSR